MFRILRPSPNVLVISGSPLQALIRLGIWVGVVAIFYAVVLGSTPPTEAVPSAADEWSLHEWLLLLFPIFLLPYLFNCVRVLLRSEALVFDGPSQLVSRKRQPLAAFTDVRELRLRAVNATCEELCLSAALADGRVLTLLESKPSAEINALAEEIAELVGVKVIRAA